MTEVLYNLYSLSYFVQCVRFVQFVTFCTKGDNVAPGGREPAPDLIRELG